MRFLFILLILSPALSRAQSPGCNQQITGYLASLKVVKQGNPKSLLVTAMQQSYQADQLRAEKDDPDFKVRDRLKEHDADRKAEIDMSLAENPFNTFYLYTHIETFKLRDGGQLQVYYRDDQAAGFLVKRKSSIFRDDVGFSLNSDCSVKVVYGDKFPSRFQLDEAGCKNEWIHRGQDLPTWDEAFNVDKKCQRSGGKPRISGAEPNVTHHCDCPAGGCKTPPEELAGKAFFNYDRPFAMPYPGRESVTEAKRLCEIAFGAKQIQNATQTPKEGHI